MSSDTFLEHGAADALVDPRALSRLRWRCRRGLLENDLFVERFLQRHGQHLTYAQARGLYALMGLADNDLLDLLLGRRAPDDAELGPHADEARRVLQQLREPPASALR